MILRIALTCSLLASVLPAQAQSDFDAAVSWLRGSSVPLGTPGPDAGTDGADDLAAAAEIVGDARVVAFGQETHGVGSFLTLEHRLFRHLVRERGFRVLVLEDSFELVRELDEALVAGGVAEVFDAIELSWHVKNAETRALLEWMETENRDRSPEQRLRVAGLDMQNVSLAARGLETMLGHLETGLSSSERETLVAFRDFSWQIGNLPGDARATFSKDLAGMGRRLREHEAALVAATSREDWELALRRVRLLEQCKAHEEALGIAPETSHALRDAFFAENLGWILGRAGADARAVVVTHGTHASRQGYTASWEDTVATTPSLGTHLAGSLGKAYVAFGVYGYRGELRPHAGGVVQRDRAAPGTWNEAFFRTGHGAFALDLRDVPASGPAATWLRREHPQSWGSPIGSALVVHEHFDAVLFVAETTVPGD